MIGPGPAKVQTPSLGRDWAAACAAHTAQRETWGTNILGAKINSFLEVLSHYGKTDRDLDIRNHESVSIYS